MSMDSLKDSGIKQKVLDGIHESAGFFGILQ
jgi:hypothetical protein